MCLVLQILVKLRKHTHRFTYRRCVYYLFDARYFYACIVKIVVSFLSERDLYTWTISSVERELILLAKKAKLNLRVENWSMITS